MCVDSPHLNAEQDFNRPLLLHLLFLTGRIFCSVGSFSLLTSCCKRRSGIDCKCGLSGDAREQTTDVKLLCKGSTSNSVIFWTSSPLFLICLYRSTAFSRCHRRLFLSPSTLLASLQSLDCCIGSNLQNNEDFVQKACRCSPHLVHCLPASPLRKH